MKQAGVVISILTAFLFGASAQADMITTGGDQTAGTGTLTINHDITFLVINDHSGSLFFTFDEIVTDDDTPDEPLFSGLYVSVNNGTQYSVTHWGDNLTWANEDWTANDGYLFGSTSFSVEIGDTITLHAGTGTMSGTNPTFNSWASGDYTVFVTDDNGIKLSENGVVPEPATASMMALVAGLGFLIRRHFVA